MNTVMNTERFGFAPDEINTAASARSARLKWVVVVDAALPPGRAANAAVCVAAATGHRVTGLLGPDVDDADGSMHPGLPWAGCSVLTADTDRLGAIRAKAAAAEGVLVVDMPMDAQRTLVYDDYAAGIASLTRRIVCRLVLNSRAKADTVVPSPSRLNPGAPATRSVPWPVCGPSRPRPARLPRW